MKLVKDLVAAVNEMDEGVDVQLGGGLRTEKAVAAAFEIGIKRVVVGTAATRNPDFINRIVAEYNDRIVVSIDSRNGFVATDGWTSRTKIRTTEALADMEQRGVSTVIFTPIEVDATEEGPELSGLREVAEAATNLKVIYASGIGNLRHVEDLGELGLPNLAGVIVGTALLRGNIAIREGDKALREAYERKSRLSHA